MVIAALVLINSEYRAYLNIIVIYCQPRAVNS